MRLVALVYRKHAFRCRIPQKVLNREPTAKGNVWNRLRTPTALFSPSQFRNRAA